VPTAWRPDRPAVRLVEAGPTILAGASQQLIDKAIGILSDLGVQVCTKATIAAATEEGFRLEDGQPRWRRRAGLGRCRPRA
jgi:NADH:ubiquinone reductase (H+-translocating)